LEKNKDPMNDTVVELLKCGSNRLVVHIFADHPGQNPNPDRDDVGKGKGKGKKVKQNSEQMYVQDSVNLLNGGKWPRYKNDE
jgi:hypothetical protein